VVLARGLPRPRGGRIWFGIAAMGLFNNVIPFTLITWGQQHIALGLASILNASTAIFGVLIAALIFADERLSPRKAAGVVLGIAGVATPVGLGNLASLDPGSLGQLGVVGAALSYGFAGSLGRVFLKGVPPLVSAAGMLSVSAAAMIPLALWRDGMPSFD
jgi:drug/metabolite transporter (DMT)-like permease